MENQNSRKVRNVSWCSYTNMLTKWQYPTILVVGGLGGSFTHEMANCNVLYLYLIHNICLKCWQIRYKNKSRHIVLWSETNAIWLLATGFHEILLPVCFLYYICIVIWLLIKILGSHKMWYIANRIQMFQNNYYWTQMEFRWALLFLYLFTLFICFYLIFVFPL